MTAITEKLTATELARYESLKQAARSHLLAGYMALKQIRDQRLYREEYGTWERFCEAETVYTMRYVNMLIRGATLMTGNNGSQIENERQARALAGLSEEEQVETLMIAHAAAPATIPSGKPTAALIEEAADTVREMKATGGYVTVNGDMTAAVASVVEKHADRVQSRREEVEAQRGRASGVIVTITKRAQCRIIAAQDRRVAFEFDDPEIAKQLMKLYYEKAGHGLLMDLSKKHESTTEKPEK